MTFPTEQDRLFFTSEEVKRIQELWEPRIGDWIWHPVTEQFHADVAVIIKLYPRFPNRVRRVDVTSHNMAWGPTELEGDWVWLPRQDQLQEMLEERGYGLYHLGDERLQPDFEGRDWNPEEPYRALAQGKEPGDYVKGTGPTPAIALGRALIEVLCVQHPEDTSASEGKEE